MTNEQKQINIVNEYISGDLSYIDAIDELIALGITALEAERIIDDVTWDDENE